MYKQVREKLTESRYFHSLLDNVPRGRYPKENNIDFSWEDDVLLTGSTSI